MNKKIYEDGYSTADIKICIEDVLSSKYNASQPTFLEQAVMAAIGFRSVELGQINDLTSDEISRAKEGSLLNTEKMISLFKERDLTLIPQTKTVHRYLSIIKNKI